MTFAVVWEPSALDAAVRFLADDPPGVDSLLEATDQLTGDSRPAASRPWGTDHRRMRCGPWRLLYRVDVDALTVSIEHIGRIGG